MGTSLIIQQKESMNKIHTSTMNQKYEQKATKNPNGTNIVKIRYLCRKCNGLFCSQEERIQHAAHCGSVASVSGMSQNKIQVDLKKIDINSFQTINQKSINEAYKQKLVQSRTHNGYGLTPEHNKSFNKIATYSTNTKISPYKKKFPCKKCGRE